jgi:hypothetical protein
MDKTLWVKKSSRNQENSGKFIVLRIEILINLCYYLFVPPTGCPPQPVGGILFFKTISRVFLRLILFLA